MRARQGPTSYTILITFTIPPHFKRKRVKNLLSIQIVGHALLCLNIDSLCGMNLISKRNVPIFPEVFGIFTNGEIQFHCIVLSQIRSNIEYQILYVNEQV